MTLWDAFPHFRWVNHLFNEGADTHGTHNAKEVWQTRSRVPGSLGHNFWILDPYQPADDRQTTEIRSCLCPSLHVEDFRHSLASKKMHFTLRSFPSSSLAMAFFVTFSCTVRATLGDSGGTTENNASTNSRPCFPTELTRRQHERRHLNRAMQRTTMD